MNRMQVPQTSRSHAIGSALGAAALACLLCGVRAEAAVAETLRVDREARTVLFEAKATALNEGEPAEFLLARTDSAKEYEAMLLTDVPPSRIDRALRSLGMKPGRAGGMNEDGIPLWPKGERVLVQFARNADDDEGEAKWYAIESLVKDTATGATMAERGFVFIGSEMLPAPDAEDDDHAVEVYAADVYGPQAVISLYNEPRAVMEIPLQAPQGEVYGRFLPNPEMALEHGETVLVKMTPELPAERRRVVDLVLVVTPAEAGADGGGNERYRLTRVGEEAPVAGPELAAVLSHFSELRKAGHSPFVVVRFDRDLPVSTVVRISRLIDTLDVPRGIRVEPPTEDQLYYRSFAPNPGWRDRDKRVMQPYEIEIVDKEAGPKAVVRHLKPVWEDGVAEHSLTITETTVAGADELGREVRKKKPGMEALFLQVPPSMSYGSLLDFTASAREAYPTVFVFTQP